MKKLMLLTFFAGLLTACAIPPGAPPGSAPLNATVETFEIKASKSKFSPKTIRVKKGTLVRLILTSEDIKHGFQISGLPQKWVIEPGKPVSLEWYADKVGKAKFKCTKFCGWKHMWMKGRIIVGR